MGVKIPFHLFIPKGVPLNRVLKKGRLIREWGVTALWIETGNLVERLSSIERGAGGFQIIYRPTNRTVIGDILEHPVDGIAIDPQWADRLIEQRDRIATKDLQVYVTHSAGAADVLDEELSALSDTIQKLKQGGMQHLFCHVSHEDITTLFTVYRFLRGEIGTRNVVSLTPRRDDEEMLYETTLRVGSLFYEDLAEVLLFKPAGGAPLHWRLIERQMGMAKEGLGMIGRYPVGYSLISCPTCGRCEIDIPGMAEKVDRLLRSLEARYRKRGKGLEDAGGITIAVMGCNVNGPGEAKGADIGIAGGKRGTGTIFREGKSIVTLPGKALLREFRRLVTELLEEKINPH